MIDYDGLAKDYSTHRRPHAAVLSELLSACRPGPAFAMLEVGCGTGNYLAEIQSSSGCACFGIDPSEEMLALAKSRSQKIELVKGSAERLGFPDGMFDLVYSVDVIHHVKNRLDYFLEAARVLRPGGRLCTVTDSEWIIKNRVMSHYFPETVDLELSRYPSIATLRVGLKAAGLREAVERQVEDPVEITDLGPFRERAFSALRLITPQALERGLKRMEADLARGPIRSVSRYLMLWAKR